jgi:predicted dehydrogenase
LDYWIIGLLDYWIIGLLDYWIIGLFGGDFLTIRLDLFSQSGLHLKNMNLLPLSRRQFVKTAALATGSVPFISSPLSRAAEPERKLGFALVGLGNLSTHEIAPALQQTKYCRLAGIVTGTPAKAVQWKAKYNIPDKNIYNYDTMVQMADNPDIDVVYVVTPNALHAESTLKAAKAGKHVLCEKPMEVSVEKCEAMIAACKQAGRQLAIGYRLHFEPNNLECVRLARSKTFGDLKMIEAGFGFSIGDPTQWRLKKDLSGGGCLMDVGIYALQATRYLSGEEPVSVSGLTTVTDPVKFKDVEESIAWQMKFPSGLIAHCAATYGFYGMDNYRAYAAKGWWELGSAYGYGGISGRRSDGAAINLGDMNQFAAEMDNFAQCIMNNQPTTVPGEEGLRDVRIMMAIYQAARTGQRVDLGSASV